MIAMDLTRRTIVPALVFAAVLCGPAWMPTSVSAQPADDIPVWALAGVNAVPDPQWLAVVRLGYVGGFDSRLLLADLMFAPADAWQVVLGYVHVDPVNHEAPATSIVRAGAVWRPLRRLVTFENRLLGERLAISERSALGRVRNRVMVSLLIGRRLHLRPFATAEFFGVHDGLDAHRYQLGGARAFGRSTVEVYWTHHRPRHRDAFHTLGLTYYVRLD